METTLADSKKCRIPAVVLLCAVLVFAGSSLFSYFFFQHIPHIHDEVAYLFQARVFASGMLYAPSPCSPSSFDFPHMINNGRWYSQYPPGFPLVLLPGLLLGVPWLVNPLLAALSVPVFYFLGKEVYGEAEGRAAAVLGSLSVWFVVLSSTMLSHTSSMFFFSLFLLLLVRSLRAPSTHHCISAGLCLGMGFLIRPYNIAAASIPWLIFFGLKSLKDRRFKRLACFAAAFSLAVGLLLVYNQATNGHPLRMGYVEKYGEAHSIGFGRTGYTGTPHSPERAFFMLGKNLKSLNLLLFGWPVSSLFFLIPYVIPLKEPVEKRRRDLLVVSSFLSLMVGLAFYWGSHVFLGPRMLFEAFPLLLLMTSRGLTKAPSLMSKMKPSISSATFRKVLPGLVMAFTLYGFLHTYSRWVRPLWSDSYFAVLTKDFAGVTPRIHKAIEGLELGRSLIIMKFLYKPQRYFPDGWWGSGFLYDDPRLSKPIIYAQDRGTENIVLIRCHPERKVFLYAGTLDKGMLVPVRLEDGQLHFGEPVRSSSTLEDAIGLVGNPREMFTVYSDAYGRHLDALYAGTSFWEVDVERLVALSRQAEDAGKTTEAVYYLETALQVENDPDARYQMLGKLALLYIKSGRPREAKPIMERLSAGQDAHVYRVAPEKGF